MKTSSLALFLNRNATLITHADDLKSVERRPCVLKI